MANPEYHNTYLWLQRCSSWFQSIYGVYMMSIMFTHIIHPTFHTFHTFQWFGKDLTFTLTKKNVVPHVQLRKDTTLHEHPLFSVLTWPIFIDLHSHHQPAPAVVSLSSQLLSSENYESGSICDQPTSIRPRQLCQGYRQTPAYRSVTTHTCSWQQVESAYRARTTLLTAVTLSF